MTPNREDYLKAIYKLARPDALVSNKEIANALQVSPASVSEMLAKLKKEGLIHYEAYKGFCLTAEGTALAVALVRGHRLWEVFLMRHLGYSWSEAHEDAELLEHITPARLTTRLDRFLNFPACCPHGNAIPQPDGTVNRMALVALNTLEIGQSAQVQRVSEEKELLDYLEQLGVSIGKSITVLEAGCYEGPLTLALEGNHIQISYKAACRIFVAEPAQ